MPFSGSLSNKISKKLSGVLGNLSGTVGKKSPQALSGTLGTLSGSLSAQRVDRGEVAGTLENFTGTLSTVVSYTITLSGTLSAEGAITTSTSTSTEGVVGFSGTLDTKLKEFYTKSVTGAFGFSGDVSPKKLDLSGVTSKGLYKLGNSVK